MIGKKRVEEDADKQA